MGKVRGLLGIVVGLMLLLHSGGAVANADEMGNNGTVKIHEGSGEAEPIQSNEPHVCTFHVHGFNFDASSSGTWRIDRHAPSGDGQAASGTWAADSSGEWETQVMTLPDGHYKLYAKQTTPATAGGEKQKVFWVDCDEDAGTTGGTTGSTGGTTGSTGGTTTGGTTGSTGGQGNVTGGNTNAGAAGGAGASADGAAASGAQGFVNVPSGQNAAAGVSPTVSNLPSTSTLGQNTGLAGLGVLLTLLGALLLRRQARQTL